MVWSLEYEPRDGVEVEGGAGAMAAASTNDGARSE